MLLAIVLLGYQKQKAPVILFLQPIVKCHHGGKEDKKTNPAMIKINDMMMRMVKVMVMLKMIMMMMKMMMMKMIMMITAMVLMRLKPFIRRVPQ